MYSCSPAASTLKPATTRGVQQTGDRLTKPHIGWMRFENDIAINLGAWSLAGANGQPRSMAIGNTLMLLMNASKAQGGRNYSFPHPGQPTQDRYPFKSTIRRMRLKFRRATPIY
jgi:hypothetical protein